MRILWTSALTLLTAALPAQAPGASSLEATLRRQGTAQLVAAAKARGDAARGAVVFYQPALACTRCHLAAAGGNPLGPDLSRLGKEVTDAHLVDSILSPSKEIRKGYVAVSIETGEKDLTGFLVEETRTEVVLRDAAQDYRIVRVPRDRIQGMDKGAASLMPSGLVNLCGGEQAFLDLVRYLMAIRDGGPARADALEPDPARYLPRTLPVYESRIDHAGMIAGLDRKSMRRGEKIYGRLCVNCHGTRTEPGSLPTSLRFATGRFRNGSDPFAMYRTLTHGFGMMNAQPWLVPRQKYDVVHYIREAFLREHNPTQYTAVDPAYLARLPKGDSRGPTPEVTPSWRRMDYGPNQTMTVEIGDDGTNFAYKGNLIRLDGGAGGISQGQHFMVFDYDTLRVAAAWSGAGAIDWNCIHFNGRHGVHPRVVGAVGIANRTGPGWGRPGDGSFADTRMKGRDGRRYGPLPRTWVKWIGMHAHGSETVLEYTVGSARVLELPGVSTSSAAPVFWRAFDIAARQRDLLLQVADLDPGSRLAVDGSTAVSASENGEGDVLVAGHTGSEGLGWSESAGALRLRIPAGSERLRFTLWFSRVPDQAAAAAAAGVPIGDPARDLVAKTRGGPSRWSVPLATAARLDQTGGPFAADVLPRPEDNPWFCRLRLTGFDFTPDGDGMFVSSWDGSLWKVTGLHGLAKAAEKGVTTAPLVWRRVASGLFQPLGVKVVDGLVYLACRDQICVLHDRNGDGEFDFYRCFNNDHQVTDHFHEFAMGLQADAAGNFYYAKSARHGKPALVPHHGTLLRVSPDGAKTGIVATGFRAANGVCVNPDGTFFVTDQEGHWNPKNRINHVVEGGFYGNMFGYHAVTDSSDAAMRQPLVWITNSFDRSPGELLWVDSPKWGPLDKRLLNFSYGYGQVHIVPFETVDGQQQGGMCAFPIPRFPTGVMRGRFHPEEGQLYLAGMFAWAGSQTRPGGLYRLRYTGAPVHLPVELAATRTGMSITFSGALAREVAVDPQHYQVLAWDLKRTANYGSKHYNERALPVRSAKLSADGKTVHLSIPGIAPTWGMEIRYQLLSESKQPVKGKIHNTIHRLRD